MVFIQAILTLITQAAGRILNTAFGWVMVVLFGKVPSNKQWQLSLISFTSILWALSLVGVMFPRAGAWLISFIEIPKFVDVNWIRLAMLPGALFLPALVGLLTTFLLSKGGKTIDRRERLRMTLRGYPFTFGLAVVCLLMLAAVPLLKLQDVVKKWRTEHIPVMIEPSGYATVLDELRQVLALYGITVVEAQPSWILAFPTRVLTLLAKDAVQSIVAGELSTLKWPDGEIIVHPSDLVVRGNRSQVTRIQALIVENLALRTAYFTWHKEAHAVEDELREIKEAAGQGLDSMGVALVSSRLASIEEKLHMLSLPQEEWSVLYRQFLQMKCLVLELEARACETAKERASENKSNEGQVQLGQRIANRAASIWQSLKNSA